MATPGETAPLVETSAPPDWASETREILCPLCEYNLRGLIEPRCPECGHHSTWSDLLNPNRGNHRWLFEHHRGRRVRSFIRTLFTSQLPNQFWKSVRPADDVRIGRLFIYWLVVVSLIALTLLANSGFDLISPYYQAYLRRRDVAALLAKMPPYPRGMTPQAVSELKRLGAQGFVDTYYPYSSLLAISMRSANGSMNSVQREALLWVGMLFLFWPWMTAAALLIFRQTLRHAKIKTGHIVRCTVYSADASVFLAVPLVPLLIWQMQYRQYGTVILDENSLLALAICALILTYRLCVAYRSYLGLPQAITTALLSQCMVFLAMIVIYVWNVPLWPV